METAMKTVLRLTLFLFCSTIALAQAAPPKADAHHDGAWWAGKQARFKGGFVIGYLEASVDGHANGFSPQVDVSWDASEQWVAGLNAFYADFRNKSIWVSDALQYVHAQIAGATDEQLAGRLQALRKAAAARGVD